MNKFSNAVLIGAVSGIITSGAMFYALLHSGMIAFVPERQAISSDSDWDRPGPDRVAFANSGSLEADLREHAQRLDELAAALDRLQSELRDDRIVASRNRSVPSGAAEVSVAALIEAGFSSEDAQAVISLVQSVELKQMEIGFDMRRGPLRSRGAGLGEGGRPAMPSTRAAIVEQFGEQGFDQYLYATGQPNRIQVSSVLADSRAQQAGFENGDVIIEVAGEAVYSNRDLYRIANEGTSGELVPITVVRGSSQVEMYAERGPLGIRANRISLKPG